MTKFLSICYLGPFIYYVRKIVGGWVQANTYNCLYTWWVGLNKFLHKISIHEKNVEPVKFPTSISKLFHKMIVYHNNFPCVFNSNTMPALA